ncbi:Uncharacterised protein [uncultured archaeon]|nr:Uncharacterised protein [uncultured archaeon]
MGKLKKALIITGVIGLIALICTVVYFAGSAYYKEYTITGTVSDKHEVPTTSTDDNGDTHTTMHYRIILDDGRILECNPLPWQGWFNWNYAEQLEGRVKANQTYTFHCFGINNQNLAIYPNVFDISSP